MEFKEYGKKYFEHMNDKCPIGLGALQVHL
jgi:hypothetical protein